MEFSYVIHNAAITSFAETSQSRGESVMEFISSFIRVSFQNTTLLIISGVKMIHSYGKLTLVANCRLNLHVSVPLLADNGVTSTMTGVMLSVAVIWV